MLLKRKLQKYIGLVFNQFTLKSITRGAKRHFKEKSSQSTKRYLHTPTTVSITRVPTLKFNTGVKYTWNRCCVGLSTHPDAVFHGSTCRIYDVNIQNNQI